jgi:hypothetical protein
MLPILSVSLVIVLAVFGVRANYSPGLYYALAVVQLIVICFAAWRVGAWAIRSNVEGQRMLATAGALFILPFALFAWLAGFGPPWEATPVENELRYVILIIDTFLVGIGFVVLRETLRNAGERFYSTLGFAAILFGTPLYVLLTAIQLQSYRALDRAGVIEPPPGVSALDELSILLIYFGVLLTYLATAAFAASLGRTQLLSRKASRVFAVISLVAAAFVVIRLAEAFASVHNPLWGFKHAFEIPGFVLLIPAMSWILPCIFGVILLKRAGQEPAAGAAL